MNAVLQRMQPMLGGLPLKALAAPLVVVMILTMMVLPLPPFALDLLFTFNIALALMVMMVSAYMVRPLDFAAFPAVLLLTTMLRLSLNVASTRVVLLHGHTGTGAAGQVIESFGHFLIGGNFAVGLIVFAILVVINFIVVTKGAERIAEVSARFTLDAMPGKQMAIDADLNAGLIDEKEAKRRRAEVGDEAEFFGSMDGASKFVRGDAVAGILILVINIVGGLIVGVAQHGLSLGQAANSYILLAVGDALVAQIPALLISIAAAMVVSRVGKEHDVGSQILKQVFSSPRSLALTGAVIGFMGVIPGMPHITFIAIAGGLGYAAWWMRQRQEQARRQTEVPAAPAQPNPDAEATWDDLQPVDILGLEVGYRLIQLVDKERKGDLLARIKGVRRKFAQEVGFLPPAVHIRDNLELKPSVYRITLRGAVIGEGECFPGMYLAINPGHVSTPLIGTQTTDPAFGLPAVWIEERQKESAQMAGFTVVDSSTVVATHLSHLMQVHAARLLGRAETQQLVEHVTKLAPKLMEDVVPKMVSVATLQKVLQLLLEESVHIRDMRTIVECLAEHGNVTDPAELARRVRVALAPAIVQQIYGPVKELNVIAIEPELERLVTQALTSPHGAALDPGVAETLTRQVADASKKQEDVGVPACLLVPDVIRAPIARLLRRAAPRLAVLGHSEIPDTHTIRIGSIIGGTA
ncbi:flagellar biosynthesis protein FlhA [Caldimonas thermodepolymerans]|jgi:flagellar biosynthesis protein FlhA|uniref:Flagellar biosynthesis protein FlhA n=1 Tax=Caldimonas thermodepolymerans TaxID=215580 RepID=A0A2S5T0G4_9BURK|nr:flagellar biosynthesis protein FlhA [Caldimonas thermodepolymerans]PPE68456.1 flagellar biosynthesis protein FlhA [Caldimonas thermodepolymerans]QPC30772.1 flagellar biosynthesis protein FlhA [Caldimonas thermodepolymerans]RDI02608.1 flagellar biosynthesis protein FlhA [Caldimonas thermodepolymerans]TCP08864.1 flagellar biosynthesis protein FlhA [Caldimonas thermodepolymerans]UZG43514.1 flagellar biosynthesis protein FlhA [Caldimonas thermodepolymerans]